jgi:CHASE2 domain-containing sensor protein
VKRYRPHILVVIALAVVLSTGWHGALRNALTDLRFAWQLRAASGNVVVVAIDAPSIDQIGVWPWPRRLHADLLHRLESAGAQEVAFDVDFSTPSDPSSDEAFVKALREVGGSTILPSFKQPTSDAVHINRPLKPFSNQSWPAVVNVAVESDGLVRRYPFGEKLGDAVMPSMAVVLAGQDAISGRLS